jgi:hypothetical protein
MNADSSRSHRTWNNSYNTGLLRTQTVVEQMATCDKVSIASHQSSLTNRVHLRVLQQKIYAIYGRPFREFWKFGKGLRGRNGE